MNNLYLGQNSTFSLNDLLSSYWLLYLNRCLKVLCLSFISGLVKPSATISALGTKLTIIRFRSYKSRIL